MSISSIINTEAHTHMHMYIYTHTYIYIYTHTYIYIYTHTYTYIYTHHTHLISDDQHTILRLYTIVLRPA